MHNLEIREDSGVFKIGGYVNVTERNSNILKDKKGRSFIEKVKSGAFKEALDAAESENREIPLMFRHKEIITNKVELREDQIGLRFEAEVNEETYNMVKDENLQCSFGFKALKESVKDITLGFYERVLEQIQLLEVTITPTPAYNGSIVEVREGEEDMKLEELLKLREELDVKIAELTPEIDSVEEVELASDEKVEVKEESAQEELAKQELEEEKSVAEQVEKVVDVIDSKLAVDQAEIEFEKKDLDCVKAEIDLDTERLERKQAEIALMRAKLKMELDLLKIK